MFGVKNTAKSNQSKAKKKTKKVKKDSEASASSQSPSTNGQVTASIKPQNLTANAAESDELERSKKIKKN